MKTSLEDISSVKKKLLIEIESPQVDKKIDKAYRELAIKSRIPGFRPGKAPRKILESRFANQVAEDVTMDLINESFPKAIEEAEVLPLGMPLVEKNSLKQGENFNYSAVIEVRPQFEVRNYLGIEVEKEICNVTEEDVRERLDQIRNNNGKLTAIEVDRPIQEDDYVVLEYEGYQGGRPLDGINSPNLLLKVGSNDFHPKFEEALIGLHKNSETEIRVDFEDTYHNPLLRGKSVDFRVKALDIKEMLLPELNDDLARSLGADFKDLEDLKQKVRETIVSQEEKRIDSELKQRLLQNISVSVDFEFPQVLVESEIARAVENIKQNLQRNGADLEKVGLSEERIRKDFRPASEKRVKQGLILSEIAKQDRITLDEGDLQEGFRELALTTGQDPERLRKYYEARGMIDSLKENMLEEKTLNYLVEHANITEVEKGALSQSSGSDKEDH
ncbi:MAG: trigger factor [Thermodesulfobacteriota bacterium]|nr:trigger factor [Thermodesulfobacteriota bacterium]